MCIRCDSRLKSKSVAMWACESSKTNNCRWLTKMRTMSLDRLWHRDRQFPMEVPCLMKISKILRTAGENLSHLSKQEVNRARISKLIKIKATCWTCRRTMGQSNQICKCVRSAAAWNLMWADGKARQTTRSRSSSKIVSENSMAKRQLRKARLTKRVSIFRKKLKRTDRN